MNKKLTSVVVLFFFLITLINAEAGWVRTSYSAKKTSLSSYTDQSESDQEEESSSDSKEDTTETREMDEYESVFVLTFPLSESTLLNLHYTYQHLLFKEHFKESLVPPPKA